MLGGDCITVNLSVFDIQKEKFYNAWKKGES